MPPPTLPHNRAPHVENFYQNSFKQLSNVQQKQVGLIVGATVADAAAHGMIGRSAEDIVKYEAEAIAYDAAYEEEMRARNHTGPTTGRSGAGPAPPKKSQQQLDITSPIVFAGAGQRQHQHQHGAGGTAEPLAFHSFSHRLFYDLLRTMSTARHDFPVHFVANKWVESAEAVARVDGAVYTGELGSLLHTLCTLLPIPTIYPYATDDAVRTYTRPFAEVLGSAPLPPSTDPDAVVLELPPSLHGAGSSSLAAVTAREAQAAEQALATDMTLTMLGVVIRFLQSNPAPERNGAFMAIPGTQDLFTEDTARFVPAVAAAAVGGPHGGQAALSLRIRQRAISEALLSRYGAAEAPLLLPRRPVLRDAATVRESLHIVHRATSFASGVVQAVRLGGPVSQRAMLVGAMLGAKYGARQIPLPWLSATVDHQPVATMAIEVAQWSWNPPSQ